MRNIFGKYAQRSRVTGHLSLTQVDMRRQRVNSLPNLVDKESEETRYRRADLMSLH